MNAFQVAPISDWTYTAAGPASKANAEFEAPFDELKQVWYVVGPSDDNGLTAHTFLLFEFQDRRLLGVSVEARLEASEDYHVVNGVFNAYELYYAWGTARDFLTDRAIFLRHKLYVYPLDLTPERRRRALAGMLTATTSLAAHPRFYNSLFDNCTSEITEGIGAPWHYSDVLTGLSAERLFRQGLIAGDSFETAKGNADVTNLVRSMNGLPDRQFDGVLLEELRRRLTASTQAAPVHLP